MYDNQQFATLFFDELAMTTCPNFLADVKSERAK